MIAGPDGRAVFEPVELAVSTDERVRWGFSSVGHNVCCRPDDSEDVALPAEARPFASYGPDESADGALVPRGETYEHTFTEPGEYVYVCVPHESRGMVGTIHVE